jgi:hypothetical protein
MSFSIAFVFSDLSSSTVIEFTLVFHSPICSLHHHSAYAEKTMFML